MSCGMSWMRCAAKRRSPSRSALTSVKRAPRSPARPVMRAYSLIAASFRSDVLRQELDEVRRKTQVAVAQRLDVGQEGTEVARAPRHARVLPHRRQLQI